jgi:hypothetical protein
MYVRVHTCFIYSRADVKNTIDIKLDLNTGRTDMYVTVLFEPQRLKCNCK